MSKRKKDYEVILGVSSITKIMIVIGIVIIICCNIPLGTYDQKQWVSTIKTSLLAIGTTVFSAGLVSVIVEISSITQIVKKALLGIVEERFPFEKLSKERLDEVYKQIAVCRLEEDTLKESDIESSPYILEPELLGLSKGLYYEYHKAKFVITPDNNEGIFKKRVEFDYKIINKLGLENSVKFKVSLICQKDNLKIEDVKSYFNIKLFKIEESDKIRTSGKRSKEINLTNKAADYLSISEIEPQAHSLYKYQISFEYPIGDKLANRIILVYEYQIPQSDIVQSYKLNYPSKILEHEISIEGNEWEVTGDAFTAFYFPDMYDKDYTVAQTIPSSIRIDFREWAVPGAGYFVTFLKK